MNKQPNIILILSGKRKSGKDYVCQNIVAYLDKQGKRFNYNLITLSAPLKENYAAEHGLDFKRLLDSSDYKEKFRLDMINWSELKRNENPSYFCTKAVENALQNTPTRTELKVEIWIVTDARRRTDLDHFKSNYSGVEVKTIRVKANESVRIQRNWKFTKGVDDCASECDLDSIEDWSFVVENNNDVELKENLKILFDYLETLV